VGKPFASGKHAFGFCDRCGQRYDLHDFNQQYENLLPIGIRVCFECMDVDHPQLQLGRIPMDDPQALRNARPDNTFFAPGNQGAGGSRMFQYGWNPIGGAEGYDSSLTPNFLVSNGVVGTVTVVTT
jgi:hypothetical protein